MTGFKGMLMKSTGFMKGMFMKSTGCVADVNGEGVGGGGEKREIHLLPSPLCLSLPVSPVLRLLRRLMKTCVPLH